MEIMRVLCGNAMIPQVIFSFVLLMTLFGFQIPPFAPPTDVFAPNVEILSWELLPAPTLNQDRFEYDNQSRVVTDTVTGHEYLYPTEIETLSGVDTFELGTLLLTTTRNRGVYGIAPDPSGQWLLNLQTGEFSRPMLVCGELPLPEGDTAWVIVPGNPTMEICDRRTGASIHLDIDQTLDTDTAIDVSPDGERLALFGWQHLYVYTISSGKLVDVGEVSLVADAPNVVWLGNNQLLVVEDSGRASTPYVNYKLGDPDLENSLQPLVSQHRFDTQYLEFLQEPPHYEWIESRDTGCWLVQTELDTGNRREYFQDDLCERGRVLIDGGDRLYTRMLHEELPPPADMPEMPTGYRPISQSLVRFNPYTGERHNLYNGELEAILEITPDNHYAVVVLDNNGQLEMFSIDLLQIYRLSDRPVHFRLAVMELDTGSIIYETPTDSTRNSSLCDQIQYDIQRDQLQFNFYFLDFYACPLNNLYSIGGGHFVHTKGETDTIVSVGSHLVSETSLPGRVVWASTDGVRFITLTPSSLIAYNTISGETLSLIEDVSGSIGALGAAGYGISVSSSYADGAINITLVGTLPEERWQATVRIP